MPVEAQSQANWQIRSYQPGDEQQIVALHNRIFGKQMGEAEYLWKVVNTPWPPGTSTVWLADAAGTIAGHYAATAMRLWMHDREWPIVHACDVMTHPDFRRQGILGAMGEAANQNWMNAGIACVTGVPHAGWGSRKSYLNWQTMYQNLWMWRLLDAAAFLPASLPLLRRTAGVLNRLGNAALRATVIKQQTEVQVTAISAAGPEFDLLWCNLRADYTALIVRDSAWLNYRYLNAPAQHYQLFAASRGSVLCGYVVLRVREIGKALCGYVADLFAAPGDDAVQIALLHYLIDALPHQGVRVLLSVVPEYSPLRKAYRRCGFVRRYGAFDVSVVPLDSQLDYRPLQHSRLWYTSGGDFDIV